MAAIAVGLTKRLEVVVADGDTAARLGSGDLAVLATPRLIALMEAAALRAVAPCLDDGQTTVGSAVSVEHLKPTAVGGRIEVEARLTAVDGRRLSFELCATENGQTVGRGEHVRYIVDAQRFMEKLK